MPLVWQQALNGLALGASYALIAIGYQLVFGVLRVVNMAHGDVLMLATYAAAGVAAGLLASTGSMAYAGIAAVVMAVIAGAATSAVLYLVAIRPVRRSHHLVALITTIAFGAALQSGVRWIWGPNSQPFPVQLPMLKLAGGMVSAAHGVTFVGAMLLAIVLYKAVYGSRLGADLRAVADDPILARLCGLHVASLQFVAVTVSGAAGGFAGVLWAMSCGSLSPYYGVQLGIKGLVALIVGGMGSFRGALMAGFSLGMIEVLVAAFVSTDYRDVIVFSVLLVVLLLRPRGVITDVTRG